MGGYKVQQLRLMLQAEQGKNGGYGAHLTHWAGPAKPINIDAGALQLLIGYYSGKRPASPGNEIKEVMKGVDS